MPSLDVWAHTPVGLYGLWLVFFPGVAIRWHAAWCRLIIGRNPKTVTRKIEARVLGGFVLGATALSLWWISTLSDLFF